MTQESLFRLIGSAGLGAGFAAGEKLPKDKGILKEFKVLRLAAVEGEDYAKTERRLIEKLGAIPKRGGEIRARQLHSLIEEYVAKEKTVIIIITRAHLLTDHTLRCLKSLRELGGRRGDKPGIVLLGKMEPLATVIKKVKSVDLRTSLIPFECG